MGATNMFLHEGRRALARAQLFLVGLASVLRRFSTFFKTRSRRLRASFDPVAIFSMLAKASGLLVFARNSLRKGCTLAKIKNISPQQPGCRKSSSLRAPYTTRDAAISQ